MKNKQCAIGLYAYSKDQPNSTEFVTFYNFLLKVFNNLKITPTYFAARGVNQPDKFVKFGNKKQLQALDNKFSEINMVSIVANPENSNAPSYDSFASGSIGYLNATKELRIVFYVDEKYLKFGSDMFENILKNLIDLNVWSYGFGYTDFQEKKPEFHVLGLDNDSISTEERSQLYKWYASEYEVRNVKLRDVYPYNIITKEHLESVVNDETSLRKFIENNKSSTLIELNNSYNFIWRVDESKIDEVRRELMEGDILISY